VLRYYKIYAEDFERISDMVLKSQKLSGPNTSYASVRDIDLSSIKQVVLRTSGIGGAYEMRVDSLSGALITTFPLNPDIKDSQEITGVLKPVQGKHDLYVIYINKGNRFQWANLEWIYFK
jgi:hypothetical protein